MVELSSRKISIEEWVKSSPKATLIFCGYDKTEILCSNEKMWNLFECESEEEFLSFCHGNFLNLLAEADKNGMAELLWQMNHSQMNQQHYLSYQIQTKSGQILEVEDQGGKMDIPGEDVAICVLTENIREGLPISEAADRLTGLFTMKQFLIYGETLLHRAGQENRSQEYYVIYSNIRHFKYYNMKYGSHAGNLLLQKLAEIITKYMEGDLTARFGDDHFVVLTDKENHEELVENIRKEFQEYGSYYGMKLKTGIYQISGMREEIVTACDLAKAACDKIRSSSMEIYRYNAEIHRSIELESYVIQHIDEAIQKGYIQVYYQPVIRTINGKFCSMEALARWIDPVYGMLSLGDFIPTLEENQLITKLDLHVLRRICREMKENQEQGYLQVPVSFNLSRTDFLTCDIFEEVEKTVQEFGIARDLLYVEVTESMVIDDPVVFKREIRRFREAGYQMWMDDFGSGYSSLNVLREYDFDEIKLDMQFLHTFDDKTKQMIRSIISMAKELHIQTLAEGVETQEQYDFLRDIGCEKVQGYLIGRPMPPDAIRELYQGREEEIETRRWHAYYAKAGNINLITDRALAVMDYDGEKFHYLYVNQAYREVWKEIEVTGEEMVLVNLNDKGSPLYGLYWKFLERLRHKQDFQNIEYAVYGHYVRLRAKLICQEKEHCLLQTEIINLSHGEEPEKKDQFDYVFRLQYTMYDTVYLYDLKEGTMDILNAGTNYNLIEQFTEDNHRDPTSEELSRLLIHREDREAFCRFFDFSTLRERVECHNMNYITEMFRTRASNGAYPWKLHTFLLVPGSDKVIYSTRYVPSLREQLVRTLESEKWKDSNELDALSWKTLKESRMIHLFSKDRERKYRGVNEKFLETFGIQNPEDVIGKTDEEMRWHIDNQLFDEDERRVLEKGEAVKSRLSKCIIKGIPRNILAAKEPVYKNDEIVGLVGSFIDVDEMTEYLGMAPISDATDPLTGLLSGQGVSNVATIYMEDLEFRKEPFAVLTVVLGNYKQDEQTYGNEIVREFLKKVGELLVETSSLRTTVGRVYGGSFVILTKYEDPKEIEALQQRIADRLSQVRELAGYPVTIQPIIKVFYANDPKNIREMMHRASGGYHVGLNVQKQLEEELRENQIQMDTLIDAFPGGMALFDVNDRMLKLTYASRGLCELFGCEEASLRQILRTDQGFGVISEDQERMFSAIEEILDKREDGETVLRIQHRASGQIRSLKVRGRLLNSQDEIPVLMIIAQNL